MIFCKFVYLCIHQQNHSLSGKTLAARGLEEHVRVSLIFAIIVSFMLFIVFTLAMMYFISKNF
jgi:hypothetical protein